MADMVNVWEQQARARKAQALASYLVSTMKRMPGLTDAEALDAAVRFCWRASQAAWDQAAEVAGVNAPSAETQAQVLAALEGMKRAEVGDVFAGLPS